MGQRIYPKAVAPSDMTKMRLPIDHYSPVAGQNHPADLIATIDSRCSRAPLSSWSSAVALKGICHLHHHHWELLLRGLVAAVKLSQLPVGGRAPVAARTAVDRSGADNNLYMKAHHYFHGNAAVKYSLYLRPWFRRSFPILQSYPVRRNFSRTKSNTRRVFGPRTSACLYTWSEQILSKPLVDIAGTGSSGGNNVVEFSFNIQHRRSRHHRTLINITFTSDLINRYYQPTIRCL